MSVDSTTLERSALERKDRDELTTIAQALGAKPPSRARKAEIVQMILELTGVAEPASGAPAAAAPAAPAAAPAAPEAEAPAAPSAGNGGDAPAEAAAPAGAAVPAGAAAPAEGPAQQALADWEAAPSGSPDAGAGGAGSAATTSGGARTDAPAERRAREGGRSDQPRGREQGSGDRDRDRGGQGGRDQGRGDEAASGQGGNQGNQAQGEQSRNQGGQGQGQGQGQGGGQGDDGESGNRRRRRRGRRGGSEQQGPGQGPSEEFAGEPVEVSGLLDLRDEGYGFLRVKGFLPSKNDIYVSVKQARQVGLRKGDHIVGASRPALRNEKNPALLRIDQVNGKHPDEARRRRRFEDLTPLFPDSPLRLEVAPENMTARIIDLIAPIGKGQRGLIVSPPKAGKTTIMKQIARSIERNSPEVKLIVLLVDERPEEVTDMRRWLQSEASEVVASTFDRPPDEHAQVAELTIERAKRLVEEGADVCIILDGITRLARAYNLAAPATGRIMSGGVDSGALYPPKKFFGAARNIEEGGSLTILATALIETGSKMDEVIFEEFKGTGNMELRLDRRLAERRIYPAIDVDASSTRHEELLFERKQLDSVWALRRVLSAMSGEGGGNAAALDLLMDRMKTFRTNDEFLSEVAKNRLHG